MKNTLSISLLVLSTFTGSTLGQDAAKTTPLTNIAPADASATAASTQRFGAGAKLRYYVNGTYLNPGALIGPALRASIRMANPPGKGATEYPSEWRKGAEGFGRNYGDAMAERTSFQTARFVTGVITHEDPRYVPSTSHNVFGRSLHAVAFTFVDHSDSGRCMPALSNFTGAAAGGFIGNAYLPAGFNNVTHAGQRATIRLGTVAAGNLFHEFAPHMPGPLRAFFMLVGR